VDLVSLLCLCILFGLTRRIFKQLYFFFVTELEVEFFSKKDMIDHI
jgi:hypothetical protein